MDGWKSELYLSRTDNYISFEDYDKIDIWTVVRLNKLSVTHNKNEMQNYLDQHSDRWRYVRFVNDFYFFFECPKNAMMFKLMFHDTV